MVVSCLALVLGYMHSCLVFEPDTVGSPSMHVLDLEKIGGDIQFTLKLDNPSNVALVYYDDFQISLTMTVKCYDETYRLVDTVKWKFGSTTLIANYLFKTIQARKSAMCTMRIPLDLFLKRADVSYHFRLNYNDSYVKRVYKRNGWGDSSELLQLETPLLSFKNLLVK